MNYGVLVLGATIQISLFLRLCSVSAELTTDPYRTPVPAFLRSQSQEEFQESIGNSPTVYGWLTGEYNYVMDKIVWDSFSPDSQEEEDMLRTFLSRSDSYWSQESSSDFYLDVMRQRSGIGDTELPTGKPIDEFCESFSDTRAKFLEYQSEVKAIRKNRAMIMNMNIDESHTTTLSASTTISEDEEVIPPRGCYFHYGDTSKPKYLVCSDAAMKELPRLPPVLDFFEMNSTSVVKIRNNSFESVQIKGIRLNKNKITEVDPHAFDGVSKLTAVEISHNQLCWIWFEFILGLDEATTLKLEHNEISLDRPELVESDKPVEEYEPTLASLIMLSMTANPLGQIPKQFFASLRLSPITFLNLKQCQLYFIHPEAFIHLKKLIILDLSENPKLGTNLTLAMQGLRGGNLLNLGLTNNNLQEIPKEALEIVKDTLNELDLRGNSFFNIISKDSFPESMPKMKSLNLENCKISALAMDSFDGMPNLDTVILKSNRLWSVPAAVTKLTKLSVLDLQNQVSEFRFSIAENTFALLKNLRILFLNDISLGVLERSALKGLTGLNMLLLGNAKLTSLEDFTFDELKSLRTLDLEGNTIKSLNSNTFYGLGNLQNLHLTSNYLEIPQEKARTDPYEPLSYYEDNFPEVLNGKLIVQKPVIDFATVGRTLNDMISSVSGEDEPPVGSLTEPFKYLTRLQYLYVSNNRIQYLSPKLFLTMSYLHHLDLSSNPIVLWQNRIFENNTVLEQLLISNSNIISVTDAMIEDFRALKWKPRLDLSSNPFLCDRGTCKLNSQVLQNNVLLESWDVFDKYICTFPETLERINLSCLSDSFCNPSLETSTNPTTVTSTPSTTPSTTTYPSEPSTSPTTQGEDSDDNSEKSGQSEAGSSAVITPVLIASAGLLVICGAVVVYRKRANFKYFWFAAKFNIKRSASQRSGKSELISESHEFDVFISYSHHDSEFIQDYLVPELEGKGKLIPTEARNDMFVQMEDQGKDDGSAAFKVCLHERDFEVGTPITENIIECVDRSRKVIVLVSRNYLESQWCLFEMNLAYHRLIESRRKSFLVILLEEVPPELRTKVLNYLMRSRTYLQWPGKQASENEKKIFFVRLRSSLSSEV